MKCDIFVKRSTITHTDEQLSDTGNSIMKSMEIKSHRLSKVRRLGVLGVMKTKLRFGIARIATRTRDSKSGITEVNRGGSNAN
jgi:hypothetical protein